MWKCGLFYNKYKFDLEISPLYSIYKLSQNSDNNSQIQSNSLKLTKTAHYRSLPLTLFPLYPLAMSSATASPILSKRM